MYKQFSGHNKETRYDVYRAASKAFDILIEKDRRNEQPLHRPKEWEKTNRREKKNE